LFNKQDGGCGWWKEEINLKASRAEPPCTSSRILSVPATVIAGNFVQQWAMRNWCLCFQKVVTAINYGIIVSLQPEEPVNKLLEKVDKIT
jgi:hypothetical protein